MKKVTLLVLGFLTLCLSACSLVFVERQEAPRQTAPDVTVEQAANTDFVTKPAQELLASSEAFSYPEGVQFIPSYLSDDGLVLGQAHDDGKETEPYLASYDVTNQTFHKLKALDQTSELVTVGIYYAGSDIVFFEEHDAVNQTSRYYIWNHQEQTHRLIHETSQTPSLHYTQASRHKDSLYLNLYAGEALYKTYRYDLKRDQLEVLVDQNSSSPVYHAGKLHYITIDQQALETAVVAQDELADRRTLIDQTTGAATYFTGLHTNGQELLTVKQEAGLSKVLDAQGKEIYADTWVESLVYQGDLITFLGNKRDDERSRPQYYLMDIKQRIDYQYEDGPIFLSQAGIFWIEFKLEEEAIGKGQMYTNEASVMRFYPFKKR